MARQLPITNHVKAAALLAEDVDVAEVARRFGVTRKTVYEWSRTDEARSVVAAIKADVREGVKHLPVANKVLRIHAAQEMVDAIDEIIADRARMATSRPERGKLEAMPGERTGHVAIKEEMIGRGVTRREAAFEASLHEQKRRWQEYAAKEMGDQAPEKVDVRHSGRVRHEIDDRRYDHSSLSLREQFDLDQLLAKVQDGGGAG